jgi:hypothetical protein
MKQLTRGQAVAVAATIVVIGTISAAIFVLGSPTDERSRRLDQRRVDELAGIADRVDLFWTRNGRVPASLDELRQAPGAGITTADPVTNQPYEYRPLGESFELCAVFEQSSAESAPHRGTFWSHGPGRHCFRREAQKIR